MSQPSSSCEKCQKSGLSLLLLRPSPVAKTGPLVPSGAQSVQSDMALLNGLVPKRAPTESRYVLRLLRAGYVHVHIPSPPPGLKAWLTYRVTEQGDLIAQGDALFGNPSASITCNSKGHNAAGLKLLHIPQVHKITGPIWIAFSANLWNDKLKSQNAANPKVMQQLELLAGPNPAQHSFKPEMGQLQGKVLECAVSQLRINGHTEHDFAFNTMAGPGRIEQLASSLSRAAACHPKTAGKELAVVLADPIGLATELNALRLRRHELAKAEMEKPENAHPLNSSNALMGLKQVTLRSNLARSYETVSPVMSKGAFGDVMRVKPNPRGWPEGTVWEPLEATPENKAKYGHGMGRVVFPDHHERAVAWARAQTKATWATMTKHFNEQERTGWLKQFEAKMKAEHDIPLARFEADWWAARQDSLFSDCFDLHFDDTDPNQALSSHCAGYVYTREVAQATTPAPLTQSKVLDEYLIELDKSPTDTKAILLRAMVANQAELMPKLQAVFDINLKLGIAHLHENRNDKLYDLAAGLLQGAHGANNPNAAQKLIVKYSWLSTALGDLLGGYTLIIAKSLYATLAASAARAGTAFYASEQGRKLLQKAQSLLLVQRATDFVLQHSISGGGLKTPMQITKRYPIGHAMALVAGRDDMSRTQIQKASKGGFIDLTLTSDNQEFAKLAGNMDEAVAQGKGRVSLPAKPKAVLLQTPAALGTLVLSEAQFSRLWIDKLKLSGRAANAFKESLSGGNAVMRSLDGRLAMGVVLINGVGLQSAFSSLSSEDARTVRNGWVGMTDSTASVIGGLLQLWEVAAKASIAKRLGGQAVQRSVGINTLRASAAALGVVAGVANSFGQFARANDAYNDGNAGLAWMYVGSGLAFAGTSVTAGLTLAGALADRQLAKGVASAAARRMAMRFGAQGAATLLGISVSGWGVILLGAAVLFEVGAVLVTPTELQKWIKRSYFGNGPQDQKFPRGDWAVEFVALEKLFSEPATLELDEKSAAPAQVPAEAV